MKSLVFNLLHHDATRAGCAAEAWEIVAEFAATEALLEQAGGAAPSASDVALPPVVVLAAEALLQCLGGEDASAQEPQPPSIAPTDN